MSAGISAEDFSCIGLHTDPTFLLNKILLLLTAAVDIDSVLALEHMEIYSKSEDVFGTLQGNLLAVYVRTDTNE